MAVSGGLSLCFCFPYPPKPARGETVFEFRLPFGWVTNQYGTTGGSLCFAPSATLAFVGASKKYGFASGIVSVRDAAGGEASGSWEGGEKITGISDALK